MSFDWTQGPLATGLECYRNRQFFLAHEHWEEVWLASPEPDKTFLQALIQVAAAFHHFERGNLVGASSLLKAALRKLESFPSVFGGIKLTSLRESICAWLKALGAHEASIQLPFPEI